jgi:hypothetical protein
MSPFSAEDQPSLKRDKIEVGSPWQDGCAVNGDETKKLAQPSTNYLKRKNRPFFTSFAFHLKLH